MTIKAVQMIEIGAEDDGQRIDNFLFRVLKGVPKSRVYRLLRRGEVRVNGGRAKPMRRLRAGDTLRIPPLRVGDEAESRAPSYSVIEKVKNSIIYEDNEMLVLNKPSGIAVHGGSGVNAGVIEALRRLRPDERRLELVHRLDRATSGCLMVAKRRSALLRLQQALRDKVGLEKYYLAVVHGEWPEARTTIEWPIARRELPTGGRLSEVSEDGKPALTRFAVLAARPSMTLLEASPITGRTHQIRVHCGVSGHPVVGDDKYGWHARDEALSVERMMLHAYRLVMLGADEQPVIVTAPPEPRFLSFIKDNINNSLEAILSARSQSIETAR